MTAEGTEGLLQHAIIQSAPLGISRGGAKMNAKMSLQAAMPFGTQYGHYPLPREAQVDEAWHHDEAQLDSPS